MAVPFWQVFTLRESVFESVAWSSDDRLVAAGGKDGCVWIYETHSGQLVRLLEGHDGPVNSVAWSHDYSRLASGSDDTTIRIWDARSGRTIVTCKGHEGAVLGVAWTHDSSQLASASSDKTVRIWDSVSGQLLITFKGHEGEVSDVSWNHDATRLASSSRDKTIRIWDSSSGQSVLTCTGHKGGVRSVAWNPDSSRLASASEDTTIRIWEASSGQSLRTCGGHTGKVCKVVWSQDPFRLASAGEDAIIRIWDVASGQTLVSCMGHKGEVRSLAWNRDSSRLVSASADNTVRIWDSTSGQDLINCEGREGRVWRTAWNHDCSRLASATDGKTIGIWDAASGRKLLSCKGHDGWIASLAWSHDSLRLASGSGDKTIRIWDVASGQILNTYKGHQGIVLGVAWNHDSSELASASQDETIRVWNSASGRTRLTCKGHDDKVRIVAWNHDSSRLASGAEDSTIRIWDSETGASIKVLQAHSRAVTGLAWTHNGKFLVSTDRRGETILWNTANWTIASEWSSLPFRNYCAGFVQRAEAPLISESLRAGFVFRRVELEGHRENPRNEVRFRCARVVLIGEGGVGKSSLAHYLLHNYHKERDSTHGLQVWKIPVRTLYPAAQTEVGERRDVFLWDLGGQECYRILHQVFFTDTRLAVFFFLPRGERDIELLEDWNHCLDSQIEGITARKLLVRSKLDIETQPDPAERITRLIEECGFEAPHHRVCPNTGEGIDRFRQVLYESLEWTEVIQLRVFSEVKAWVERAWKEQQVTLCLTTLEARAQRESSGFTRERFEQAIRFVIAEGVAIELRTEARGRLLVNPEPLERYAGSIILEAMREKPAPVVEYFWIMNTGVFPRIEKRLDRGQELEILECAVQLLLERHLCLWVERMLVFPQLFADKGWAPGLTPDSIRVEFTYEFTGPIQHVYATLAVSLALLERFGQPRYWGDQAEYRLSGDRFIGLRVERGERKRFGKGRIEIYCSRNYPEDQREDFYVIVADRLRSSGVRIEESQQMMCPELSGPIPTESLDAWKKIGRTEGACPVCGKHEITMRSPLATVNVRAVNEMDRRIELATGRSLSEVREQQRQFTSQAPMPPQQPIRILHLTDFHFEPGQDPILLAQPLLSDLRKLKIESFDFLVASADFANRGVAGGFETAKRFLHVLIGEAALITSPERLILTPGNHDLVWERKGFVESDTPDGAWSMETGLGTYWIRGAEYMERFRHFYEFYKDLKIGDYARVAEEQCAVETFEAERLQFVTLNSAWETDSRQPRVGSLQAGAVARAIRKIKAGYLPIGVWHHALADKSDYHLQEESLQTLSDSGMRIVLHGHVHERRSEMLNPYVQHLRLHMMGGGSFAAKTEDRPVGTPRMYNLLEVDREHRWFAVTTRSQVMANGPFEAYTVWPKPSNPDEKTARLEVNL